MSDEVVAFLEEAIRLDPKNPAHYNNLSCAYAARDNLEQAIYLAEQALMLDPDSPTLCSNLGIQYRKALKHDQAIECFQKAVALEPNPHSWANLATSYLDNMMIEEAISCAKRVLQWVDDPGAHLILANCYHLMGVVQTGWEHYEHRLQLLPQLKAYVALFPQDKMWVDQDLTGKRIIVFCEQGYGDTIQFCRYLPDLKSRGCTVIANCDKQLLGLLSNQPGVDAVADVRDTLNGTLPDYDFHVCSMSLPHKLQNFKYLDTPYIASRKFGLAYQDKIRVGICWKGNKGHKRDAERSMDLLAFTRFSIPDVKLISLVKELSPLEQGLMDSVGIADMSVFMSDFEDTAKIIADLDLVITVDTSILHLSGAMGIKTWALIPFRPDFRWAMERENSRWYSRVRLFRQDQSRSWKPVLDRIEQSLLRMVRLNRTCNSDVG